MKTISENCTIKLPAGMQPQLQVVIDTEEEFDWSAPPDRNATAVSAMNEIGCVQDIFDDYGIVPCYVVDYPVVSQEEGVRELKKYYRSGRCEIGAHLHPWVTPPHEEALSFKNSYAGNLPRELEKQKLQTLTSTIADVFGEKPRIYKAGRYGLGPNSSDILQELGYEIDLSICPPVDYRADGGPDYRKATAHPIWLGKEKRILSVPVTGAFVGWGGKLSHYLYDAAGCFQRFKARGILSKSGMVDRLMLSPEGFSSKEHIKITKALLAQGVRTFTWSFHSTSVVPGMAPYVKTRQDLTRFLDSFRYYFDYFFDELSGIATTPVILRETMEKFK